LFRRKQKQLDGKLETQLRSSKDTGLELSAGKSATCPKISVM